jgi:structure-specific recognition protein 1
MLSKGDKAGGAHGLFELNLGDVTQCVTPGHKQDELDIQFLDVDSGSREDQSLYSMRLWVPGQQAAEIQTRILSHSAGRSQTGDVLVEFDREQGNFVAPKNKYSVELYENHLRMHGSTYDFKISYKDVNRFYMLEYPRARSDAQSWYFVICLDKPVRQGQQKYPFLVWQTHNEEANIEMNMAEEAIEERYPGAGLKPSMEGSLHKLIAKIFKVLSGKTVFSASKKYLSASESKCVTCNLGQRSGVLYPMDKSFLFLHQPVLVIEYTEVEFVEFKKEPNTRNFEFLVQLKTGKKHQFGSIEKKEFRPLLEFLRLKEALFQVRNDEEEEAEDDGEDSEDDEDFNSNDEAAESNASSSDDSDDSDNDDDDDDDSEKEGSGGGGGDKAPAKPKKKRKHETEEKTPVVPKASSSPVKKKKAKKDPLAPKQATSAYFFFADSQRETIKAENPDATFGEVGKITGAKWKALSDEDKAPFNEKAMASKEKYKAAMAVYVPPEVDSGDEEGESDQKKRKVKPKKEKDPNAPKKPTTAFFFFMEKERSNIKAQHPEFSIGELGKEMGSQWRAMSEEDKAPFNEKAVASKEKYQAAMEAYSATKADGAGAAAEDNSNGTEAPGDLEDDEEEEDGSD